MNEILNLLKNFLNNLYYKTIFYLKLTIFLQKIILFHL
jgi:hypothetical protein